MELTVKNASGEASLEVRETVFGAPYNEALVHQVVTAYMAGARAGTRAHKTRAQVSGGGVKPWRQKGTGRARAGSSRSPIWRGGGKTFASVPVNHQQKVNRKMYRGALRAIFSELLRQGRLTVVEEFTVEDHKTKALAQRFAELKVRDVLVIVEADDEKLLLACRNLPWAAAVSAAQIDPVSLLAFESVICTVPALRIIEERVS